MTSSCIGELNNLFLANLGFVSLGQYTVHRERHCYLPLITQLIHSSIRHNKVLGAFSHYNEVQQTWRLLRPPQNVKSQCIYDHNCKKQSVEPEKRNVEEYLKVTVIIVSGKTPSVSGFPSHDLLKDLNMRPADRLAQLVEYQHSGSLNNWVQSAAFVITSGNG